MLPTPSVTLITRMATSRGEMNHEGGGGDGRGEWYSSYDESSLWGSEGFNLWAHKSSIRFWCELIILLMIGHDLPHRQASPLWFRPSNSQQFSSCLVYKLQTQQSPVSSSVQFRTSNGHLHWRTFSISQSFSPSTATNNKKLSFYTLHKQYIQQTNNYSHRRNHTYHKLQPYRQLICNVNCKTLFLGEKESQNGAILDINSILTWLIIHMNYKSHTAD